MRRYRIYILFVLIVSSGFAAVILVSLGHYPIAVVNGRFISARQFTRDYATVAQYYEKFLQAGGESAKNYRLNPEELELAALTGLIEKVLVGEGAKAEVGKDFRKIILSKIQNLRKSGEFEEVVERLRLSKSELEKGILWPQAEREILAGRLFLRGEKLEDWLRDTKASANVIIFSPDFNWNGEAVVAH